MQCTKNARLDSEMFLLPLYFCTRELMLNLLKVKKQKGTVKKYQITNRFFWKLGVSQNLIRIYCLFLHFEDTGPGQKSIEVSGKIPFDFIGFESGQSKLQNS